MSRRGLACRPAAAAPLAYSFDVTAPHPRPLAGRRRAHRDRRGRGLRGRLAPPSVPLSRTRRELFDDLVLDAVEHLEGRWSAELSRIEFAVEDVPIVEDNGLDDPMHGSDVVEDGDVPLSRILPEEVDGTGRRTPPRIVLYRRPLEVRARNRQELGDLVHDIVVEQLANLLGRDPDDIDPQ